MIRIKTICSFMALLLVFSACKKDEPAVPVNKKGSVVTSEAEMAFRLYANSRLVTDSGFYTNNSADTFSIGRFTYYISNIKLIRSDGFEFREKESYHLIKHMEGQESFRIKEIPTGNYLGMEFLIGVDSLRNVSGIQSGALDPAHDMFWNWSTGYIFFKMEGLFCTKTQPGKDNYAIHIGGFQTPFSCLQKVTLNFDTVLNVRSRHTSTLRIRTTADEVFKTPHPMGFDQYYSNITEKTFQEVSENYRDMFSVEKIEN